MTRHSDFMPVNASETTKALYKLLDKLQEDIEDYTKAHQKVRDILKENEGKRFLDREYYQEQTIVLTGRICGLYQAQDRIKQML